MLQNLLKLPRKNKQALMLLFDVVAIIGSIFAAFSIRLGYLYYPTGVYLLTQHTIKFINTSK